MVFINYIVTPEQRFVKRGRKMKQQKIPDILTAAQAAALLRVGRIPAKSVRKFMRKTSAKAL